MIPVVRGHRVILQHKVFVRTRCMKLLHRVERDILPQKVVVGKTWRVSLSSNVMKDECGLELTERAYPAFVLCLLDAKARVFAIRSCKSNEPKGFKFSKPRGEQKGVVTISNKNLLDPLRAVTGEDWIPGKRYKVRGFWVADAKTMCFDLNEGVQEDFRPVTPNNDAE